MKKRIFTIILVGLMLSALTACGSSTDDGKDNNEQTNVAEENTSTDNGDTEKNTSDTPNEGDTAVENNDNNVTAEVHDYVQTSAEDYSYIEMDDHVILGAYNGNEEYIITPTEINGKPVTAIFFENYKKDIPVKGIQISEGVTELCDEAFWHLNIEEVTLPESLEYIGRAAFGHDQGEGTLTGTVRIPPNVKYIGDYAFSESQCGFEFTGGLEYIGQEAFANNSWVEGQINENEPFIIDKVLYKMYTYTDSTEITVPEGVVSISDFAFKDTGCTKIVLPKSLKAIGNYAFSGMYALNDINIEELPELSFVGSRILADVYTNEATPLWEEYMNTHDVAIFGDTLYWYKELDNENGFTIPAGVRKLGTGLFMNSNIESVSIPDSVVDIGDNCFYKCEKLKSVALPGSVKYIGTKTFQECRNLEATSLSEGLEYIGDSAFYKCDTLNEVILPVSVKTVGSSVFSDCKKMETLDLGSLTYINNSFASDCSSLKTVKTSDSLSVIGYWAFTRCGGLESIELSDNVKVIGKEAFNDTPIADTYAETTDELVIVPDFPSVAYARIFG